MKKPRGKICVVLSALALLGFVVAACAPAAAPVPNPTPMVAPTPTVPPTSTPRVVVASTPTPTPAPAPKPTLTPTPGAATTTPVDKPRYGGILKVGGAGDLAHFDMHQETQTRFHAPLAPAYDLLVQMDPADQSKVIADLAQSWEMSADGKVYTFRLAKEVKFHDGRPLTSADVKASFERIFWPPKGMISPRDSLFESVSKLEAPDDYSVVFTLKYPQSSFLALLALGHNFIVPKHILDKNGDMKKDVMGTGPFKFKEYARGVSFETAKNPDYFVRGRPYLDGIITYIIPDAAARVAAFRSRNIHLIWPTENPLSSLEREALLKQTPTIVVQSVPGATQNYLFPNHKRGPWQDARVRRAASLATDRQASVKVVWFGDAVVGADFVPGSGWGLSSEELAKTPGYREPKDADIAEAKRLLTEAGYPKGFKTTILTREESRYIRMAVFRKGELAKIGIDATVQPNETAIFNQIRNAGNFDALISGSGMLLADADVVLSGDYISNAGKNYGFYSNPKVDDLTLKQRTSIDPEERKKIVREIQQILLEDVSRIVTDYQTMILISWPEVKNNRIGSTPFPFKKLDNVWLAQ